MYLLNFTAKNSPTPNVLGDYNEAARKCKFYLGIRYYFEIRMHWQKVVMPLKKGYRGIFSLSLTILSALQIILDTYFSASYILSEALENFNIDCLGNYKLFYLPARAG